MKDILVYQPPADPAQVSLFIDGLEPKLREKLLRQIIPLPRMPPSILREPHYKHFTLERYRSLYEVRAKGGIAVRVIFTILPEGRILLLCGFVKKQSRDTMRALEQSLRILSELRDHPEYAVEYKVKEEEPT
ncbi:MAG: type II toxin-antitoxin system RelE/ParE family toxin [Oscillospiraceae bacterium]|nr:type II toxin-antitoxin system RelE/ParE family toxin [Oscillospiraceae bacterium]